MRYSVSLATQLRVLASRWALLVRRRTMMPSRLLTVTLYSLVVSLLYQRAIDACLLAKVALPRPAPAGCTGREALPA